MAAKKAKRVKKAKKAAKKVKRGKKPAAKKTRERKTLSAIAFVRDAILNDPEITTAVLRAKTVVAFPDSKTVKTNFPVLMARARKQLVDSKQLKKSDFGDAKKFRSERVSKKSKKKKPAKKTAKKKAKKKKKKK